MEKRPNWKNPIQLSLERKEKYRLKLLTAVGPTIAAIGIYNEYEGTNRVNDLSKLLNGDSQLITGLALFVLGEILLARDFSSQRERIRIENSKKKRLGLSFRVQ